MLQLIIIKRDCQYFFNIIENRNYIYKINNRTTLLVSRKYVYAQFYTFFIYLVEVPLVVYFFFLRRHADEIIFINLFKLPHK